MNILFRNRTYEIYIFANTVELIRNLDNPTPMTHIKFYKYHGTANDFIMIEDRDKHIETLLNQKTIEAWCSRRFGVGADGLILLQEDAKTDFYMKYYNSDGNASSMCGNGGRCISQFAYDQNWIKGESMQFMAVDGLHRAIIDIDKVFLSMTSVPGVTRDGEAYVMDTGSPHYVRFDQLDQIDIEKEGSTIRYNDTYNAKGINVNIAEINKELVSMQTYERGVEAETYSCGTGTVAVALSSLLHTNQPNGEYEVQINTKGGQLAVRCKKHDDAFVDIYLIGPAVKVFEGIIAI